MNYRYKARDRYGKAVAGIISGEDRGSIAKHLTSLGYIPITIEEAKDIEAGLPKFLGPFLKRVRLEGVIAFTMQLLTLEKAGIPLLSGLAVLEKQTKNRYFKDIIKELISHIEGGLSLSAAMAKYPGIFSELYVNMIKAGEASGLLDEALARLVEFGEREVDTRARIKAATWYPLMTLVALFFAFIIIVTFVIPKFSSLYSGFRAALPLPTRMLLNLSFVMRNYWHLGLIIMGLAAFLFFKYINTKEGRFKWDSLKLKSPIFGPITSMLVMSRFTRTMSILMRSGLPILQVLDLVSRTIGNSVISRTVDNIAQNVRDGKGISEPMRISGLFPPIVVQMVAVGEDTGKIDELLMKVSEYYDQESNYLVKNLTATIEPVFVLVLGAMVLTMALSIFLPMWNLVTVFRR